MFELQPDGSHLRLFPEFTTTTGAGLQLWLGSAGNFWFPRSTSSNDGDIAELSPSTGAVIQSLMPFGSSTFAPAELIQAKDKTFWGVSQGGIVTSSGHFGDGTVFKVNEGKPAR